MLSATHAGTATQLSVVAFQVKAGALQAQLVWPTRVLLVLYSSVAPHGRQAVSPATAKLCAGQVSQTALLVFAQALVMAAPAPQVAHAAQGE